MKTPENTPLNDCPLKNYCYLCSHNHGVVLEWLKRHAWKACIPQKGIPSSNLGHSANNQRQKSRKHTCLRDFLPFAPTSPQAGSTQDTKPGSHFCRSRPSPREPPSSSGPPKPATCVLCAVRSRTALPPPFLPSFFFLLTLSAYLPCHATTAMTTRAGVSTT